MLLEPSLHAFRGHVVCGSQRWPLTSTMIALGTRSSTFDELPVGLVVVAMVFTRRARCSILTRELRFCRFTDANSETLAPTS